MSGASEWTGASGRPSEHLAYVVRSSFALFALCLVSRSAYAQVAPVPGSEAYCTPGAPCPPPPPNPPPAYSPALDAQTRARHEADVRARIEPSMRNDVALELDEKRRQAWIERGRIRERDPVPLRYPLVQSLVLGGVGVGRLVDEQKDGEGALVVQGSIAARLVPQHWFAFELGTGVSTTAIGPADRYGALHIQPAFLLCGCDGTPETVHTVVTWVRGAIDVGLPIDGGSRTPDVLVALKLGVEVDLLVSRLGDGGFAAAVIQFNGTMRFAAGGETSILRKPVGGIELLVGPSIAF